jgi:hypothetical protein
MELDYRIEAAGKIVIADAARAWTFERCPFRPARGKPATKRTSLGAAKSGGREAPPRRTPSNSKAFVVPDVVPSAALIDVLGPP